MPRYPFYLSLLLILAHGLLSAQSGRLADFSAVKLRGERVLVRWTMKAGVSCQSPEVERSVDGETFTAIFRYPGICGGGATEESFDYIDPNPILDRTSYYRLKIDDSEYSSIAELSGELGLKGQGVWIYPNPANNQFTIDYLDTFGEIEELKIYNAKGKEVQRGTILQLDDSAVQLSTKLSSGIYYLRIRFEEEERIVKLLNYGE